MPAAYSCVYPHVYTCITHTTHTTNTTSATNTTNTTYTGMVSGRRTKCCICTNTPCTISARQQCSALQVRRICVYLCLYVSMCAYLCLYVFLLKVCFAVFVFCFVCVLMSQRTHQIHPPTPATTYYLPTPPDPRMWCAVGNCLTRLSKIPDAILAYERAAGSSDTEGIAVKVCAIATIATYRYYSCYCYISHLPHTPTPRDATSHGTT